MLLIGNLKLFVYFGINAGNNRPFNNEGIQIWTIVILAIVTVVYGLFLAIVPWEFIGGPFCSANEICQIGGEEEEAPTQEAQDQVVRYLVNQSTNMIRVFLCFFVSTWVIKCPRLIVFLSHFYESIKKPFKACLFDASW